MKKIISNLTVLFVLMMMLSISVNAFAVSMRHMEDKTLVLYPGESLDFRIVLQNMVGDQDEMAKVTIKEGHEVIRIIDKENIYKIPKGTMDTVVNMEINIPNNASLGKVWDVRFNAQLVSVSEKEGGMVQFSTAISDGFKVRIGPIIETQLKKEKFAVNVWWTLGGIILIILIVLALVYRYKRKKK